MTISWQRFHRAVRKLTSSIKADSFCPDVIVAVGLSGLIPAAMVAKQMACKDLQLVIIESYKGRQRLTPRLIKQGVNDISGKKVLCVDDIIASGMTRKLTEEVLRTFQPEIIKFAVPIVSTAVCKAFPDYWGEEIMRSPDDFIQLPWD
ncbi:MAG: phosphoribosyltransferase family protein [Candidatus Berkelbacteria bacterium]|nr:phosphoribosyltransferase family protein [Candidatus Berkelbacteria bacterium]MCR4307777.1 phosphoribosyltransferase family protein [Candidatus Berkelbacteria bacterium]